MKMLSPPKYIVGLDLGDGESSIAYVSVSDGGEPQIFETTSGERSMITAITSTRSETLIGNEALIHEEVIELDLSFKYEPTSNQRAWRTLGTRLRRFAEEFYLQFEEAHPQWKGGIEVYIGHPSGWEPGAVDKYDELFRNNQYIPTVHVVPESRSAFIHVRDYCKVSRHQLDSVLVVDIGSSTTDFTYVKNLKPRELSYGDAFGARLIDQLIYADVLERYPNASDLRERLERKDRDKAYLLYLCRKAKEQYFTDEPFTPQPENDSFKWILEQCWPYLKKLEMDAILKRPVEGFQKGWKAGFRELLVKVRKTIEPDSPKVLLLTGGGSRMPFTKEICQAVFQHSVVNPDPEPSFSVARGLAGFGRWRYRVERFREAVKEFCASATLDTMIRKHTDSFGKGVFNLLAENAVDAVLRPMVHELREGTLTTEEIDDYGAYFYGRYTKWLNTPEGLQKQKKVFNGLIDQIMPYVKAETEAICDRFHIARASLEFDLRLDHEKFFKRGLIDKIGNKVMEWQIKLGDRFIPHSVRQWVPKTWVDWYMNFEDFLKKTVAPFIEDYAKVDANTIEDFVFEIRAQIEKQLMDRASQAEDLIR
jgi:hypothetical protein